MADTRATLTVAANLDPSGVLSAVKTMQGAFSNLKLPNNIGEGLDKSLSKATDLLKKYQSQLAKGINTKTDAKNITKTGTQINEVLDEITHHINELNGQQIFLKTDVSGLNKLQADIENARTAWKNAIQEFRKGSDIDKVLNGIGQKTTRSNLTQGSISKAQTLFDKGDLEGYRNALDEIYNRVSKLKDTTVSNVVTGLGLDDAGSKAANLALIKKQLDDISKIDFSSDANVKAQFDEITNTVNAYEAEVKRAGDAGQQAFNNINASSAVNNTRALVDATDQYTDSVMSAKNQIKDLQQSTQYFFSLRNMINLLKRGIDEAIQSVKELDAAMTETAVVTDYKVSDMWNMLPQYTQLANQLGATTQGAYETMTLYFQQGLDQQQAFELGAETMKMARIAGLDYAETTDMMTAALRGFNMELNETSAKRVNDVYSELAAITASDTEELGTAMQRTASIAHSAGSSFEGTTAFLAQAIETTREPAENIGTAMKTIIARFQEMKKNPLEISEVDGEEVDFNKIDAALKTIGVDLVDTNGQFRDFDKVMLDISSRWDTLSQSQQRYIATVAAGSRQQSRFIAMVSDYDRTMELMEAANNSAGASDEQFGKTMDSLESKLNKLHNAWQAFTMGIANNGMIKLAVDGITSLLTGVNSLIDTFSGGIGPIKSFLSLFTAFTGLKASGKIMNSIIGGLGGLIDPTSTFSIGFGRGMTGNKFAGNAAFAAQINQPIVAGLREVVSAINKDTAIQQQQNARFADNSNAYAQRDAFKNASAALKDYSFKNPKIFTINELRKQLSGLTGQNQNLLMRSNASTFNAATNALLLKYAGKDSQKYNALKAGERNLNDARKAGQLTAEQYYQHLQDPGLLKDALLRSGIKQDNPAYQYLNELNNQITARATEITKQETEAMREQFEAYQNSGEYNHLTEADLQKRIQDEILSEEGQSRIRSQALKEKGLDPEFKNTAGGKILQSLGRLGGGISQAGMGIQAFGSILMSSANPALQTFGAALTSIGGLISNLGMAVSGLSSGFSAIAGSKFMTSLAGSGTILGGFMTTAGAVTGGLMLLVGAIAGAAVLIKKHNEKIKKDAEKVTTDYKEKSEQHQSNISNLTSYREDFARLSAGVDANGMNINLDTADYEHYLEITKAIASINPEIVDGYNAQGNAIISNKNALEETLAIEKERQSTDFSNYIDPTSTEKLIAARNLSRQSKDKETFTRTWDPRGTMSKNVPVLGYEFAPQAEMRKQAQNVGKNLQAGIKEGWAKEDILKDFNISADDLTKGNENAIRAFEQNYDKIKARISSTMDSAGDELKDKTKESMLDAFSGYNEASDELDELITPLYEQQLARIGKKLELPSEFKSSFNQGLKEIVSDANITDVEGEVDKLTTAFSNLSSENSEYSKILKDITDAQDKYAESLNKTEYDAAAKDAKERIEALKASLGKDMDLTQGYGKAVSDFLENEIHKIENFTKDGAANLQHALNTMTDQIAAAEGALENFNSIAEGSTYGKAASNMSQIFETATADEHALGEGDQAFWAGAEALIGRKNLLEGGGTNKDKALEQMKEVQEMLKGGQEGWDNFKIKWFDSADAKLFDKIDGLKLDDSGWISEINEDLNPQVYDQIADALNMSKDSLVAMLNLGRQFGEVDFTNVSEVRKALATSETTIKNADKGKVFVKEEALDAEMTSAGIDLNKQQEIKKDLQDNYKTELIKSANEITKANNQFAEMGITSMESLVKTFDDTGQFTKDEIRGYAEKWAEFNGQQGELAKFDEYWKNNQQDNEFGGIPGSLDSIQSILSSIESILASQRLSEGYLDNPTADASKKWLFGGKGEDTAAQKFWKGHGSGVNGEITTSEFNQTSKELTDFIAKGKDYIAQLDKVTPANETERKQIEAEKEAYKYQVDRANTYLKEGTETYNTQVQNKIDAINQDKEAVDKGFADLLGSITPESINTDAAQSTLNQLYEAAINNTPAVLTDGLMAQMQSLGIDIQKAIDAGLVIDENGVLVAAQEAGKETAEAGVEGNAQGQEGVDTTPAKTAGEQKGKETGQAGVEGNASGQNSVPHQAAPGMPSNVPPNTPPSKIEVDSSQLEEANQKATELTTTLTQGSTYTITVNGVGELQKAARAAKTISANSGNKTVGVKASFDSSNVTKGMSSINNMKAKLQVEATVDPAIAAARRAVRTIDSMSATIDVSTSVTGQYVDIYVTKHVSEVPVKTSTGGLVVPGGPIYRARGGLASNPMFKRQGTDTIPAMLTPGEYVQNRKAVQYFGIDFMQKLNHKDLIGALQSFGSMAKGRYGRLGPNGKGGLTLTGEEGFEVGWIPSENRSIILGANGPQMVDLPSDAIIWDHKQSKKIINQNVIPAGSHYVRGKKAPDPRKTQTSSSGNGGGNGGGGGGGQDSDTIKQNADNAKDASKVIKDAGWVTVWWENMTRRVDSTQKKIDNLSAKFDKQIKTFGTTVTSIQSTVKGYRNNLNQSISLNRAELKQAKKELKLLDAGGNFYSRKEVSYEETEGDKKESKKMTVSLGNYIKYNKKYGIYEIDQQKINQVGLDSWTGGDGKKHGGNKSLAEAIKEAAEKEINDRNSKIKTAEDNIKKAQEALEKVSNDVYETFYGWEKSINRVYLLGKKLETITQQLSVTNAKLDLQFNKIVAGATNAAGAQAKINEALVQQRNGLLNKVNASKQNLSATKSEFQNSLSLQPYLRNYLKNPNSTAARNDYVAAKKTLTFLDKVNLSGNNFNYTEALKYLNNAGMSKDEYDAIKNNLDKIFEKQSSYLQAQETAQQSISEIYQTMEEYQSFIADFEADLLTGMEEEAENQIQHLEKLNSSLTKALKDLLDEVKNRLDQRRKQEDNKKTESDLSQKQQRLTMLRADTGGGHAVEIAQLEKELAEAQQNYQRTLEDQLLERLQQQGDIAEKQRQHQIDLLSIQNQIAKETGTNLAQVKEWMNDPEKYYDQIRAAWLENQHYDEVAPDEQKNLEEQFEQNFAKFRGYKAQLDKYDEMIGQLNTLENDVNRIATEVSLNKPEHTAADMKAKGYSAKTLKRVGYNVSSLVNAGYNKKELKEAGITAKDLAKNKVSASAAKKAGFSAKDLMQAGYSAKSLLKAGYNPISVAKAGYSGKQLKEAGITSYLSKKGITDINQAIDNGISKSVASGIYGAKASLQDANLSGALTQKATGASLATLQKIVNKNPNDKATQKDLAGVKTKIDTNGKDKGGITEGSVNANGKWIYANVGSTLKGQRLDTKTGKGTGKVYTVTIDKLTATHFKNNKAEATQALVYAITHQAWGSKINSNFSALVKAAGINGKQYKLGAAGHNWYASVGGDGLIYQNTADGVAKWNPATGKTWIEKYNQKNFLAIAKRNNGVSREYAQVLIDKKAYTKKQLQKAGVKQFLTGGLANYTGPAWLDGTPSKPELILNAQDTKNFIALKDVLSKAMSSTGSVSNEYSGNATYEININVDHLNSDYDVDKVVERVKKRIVQDSGYRNVTQVRKFR